MCRPKRISCQYTLALDATSTTHAPHEKAAELMIIMIFTDNFVLIMDQASIDINHFELQIDINNVCCCA